MSNKENSVWSFVPYVVVVGKRNSSIHTRSMILGKYGALLRPVRWPVARQKNLLMDSPMIKIRYVVKGTEGRSTLVAAHPVEVQLPTIGDQVMATDSDGRVATLTVASQPQFEYEAVGDETQKLVFLNYYVTR